MREKTNKPAKYKGGVCVSCGTRMTKAEAVAHSGDLSTTGKMPGPSWSIDAERCHRGSVLYEVEGSVCHNCYARGGMYRFKGTKAAMARRLAAWQASPVLWREAMIHLIHPWRWFRWFDSGDIQSPEMLDDIVKVCEATPDTSHWLPSKEATIVGRWLDRNHSFPGNLTVRLSAEMVDGVQPAVSVKHGLPWSVSSSDEAEWSCPAHDQDNKCGDCRTCWDRGVDRVVYPHRVNNKIPK